MSLMYRLKSIYSLYFDNSNVLDTILILGAIVISVLHGITYISINYFLAGSYNSLGNNDSNIAQSLIKLIYVFIVLFLSGTLSIYLSELFANKKIYQIQTESIRELHNKVISRKINRI